MKKLLIISAFLTSISFLNAQTYQSNFQIDMASSGNKEAANEKATLVFSKEKGEFSIKYEKLKTTHKFKIKFLDNVKRENPYTIYTIENDINYGGLKVENFLVPIEGSNGDTYSKCFTIIGMNKYGEIGYYTSFYIK